MLLAVALVELARAHWVEDVPVQTRCWPVMVQQVMAMSLQFGAISADAAWTQLARVPDFKGISRAEFDELIAHLVRHDFLYEAGGKYSLGDKAEKLFGRKNFQELYAVFTAPVMYRVVAGAQEIGSIEPTFVESLVEGMSSFLLGGRAWVVDHIVHSDREVHVKAAPAGKKPAWGGFMPRFLGREVCGRIRKILETEETPGYLDEQAKKALAELRADLGPLLLRAGAAVQVNDEGYALWWTFAGGRINHTLKYALEVAQGWKVVAESFFVKVTGEGVSHAAIESAVRELAAPEFWSEERMRAIRSRIPAYRLSKFQDTLPDFAMGEILGSYFLDPMGALDVAGHAEGNPKSLV